MGLVQFMGCQWRETWIPKGRTVSGFRDRLGQGLTGLHGADAAAQHVALGQCDEYSQGRGEGVREFMQGNYQYAVLQQTAAEGVPGTLQQLVAFVVAQVHAQCRRHNPLPGLCCRRYHRNCTCLPGPLV